MDPWDRSGTFEGSSETYYLEKNDIMENIETDQSYYRIDDKGSKRSFDQHLANIAPCDDELGSYNSVKTGRVLNLDPDHGFI